MPDTPRSTGGTWEDYKDAFPAGKNITDGSPTMTDTLTREQIAAKHIPDPETGVHRGPLPDESLTYACAECWMNWPCDVVTLAKAPLDVERLARAMVDADLDDIPEPDDIFDSMPEARLMAERIAAKYAEEPHDA